MKLTIWQQFASNHSGYFFVVGTFQTVEATYQAANTLQTFLQQIAAWYVQQDEPQTWAAVPTPVEQAFSRQYKVEWPMALDWLDTVNDMDDAQQRINRALTVCDRLIFVSNPDQTWMSIQPFEGLLRRLGATTAGFDYDCWEADAPYPPTWFTLTLTCVAPDTAAATGFRAAWVERHPENATAIHIADNRIQIVRMWLPLGSNFRDLLHDLEQHGCTGIDYTLAHTMMDEGTAQ